MVININALTSSVSFEKHKFNFKGNFKFKGYSQGGFELHSDEVLIMFRKSELKYTKIGDIETKEDFAKFIFGLADVTYFSSNYFNGEKYAYAIYKPIFSGQSRQMTFLMTNKEEVFSITFRCSPDYMSNNYLNFIEWVKAITIELDLT